MIRKYMLASLFCSTFSSATAALGEATISQLVDELHYEKSTGYSYFIGENAWGAPSCPDAVWVRVNPDANSDKFLATVIAMKVAGIPVTFLG